MMDMKALNYNTYEEAVKRYKPSERWLVFDGKPEKFNIAYECIDRHVDRGVAIRVKFADGLTESYTFMELSRFSSQFANMLKNLDIHKGDPIAILLEPSLEFYVAFFGGLKAGTPLVLCSPLLGFEALNYRLQDSKAKLVITDKQTIDQIRSPYVKKAMVKDELIDIVKQESDKFEYSTSVNDTALIQYTSGATGLPKPIIYRHKSLVSLAPASRFAYGVKDEDSFFCPSAVAWGHFVWGGTCGPLMFGVPTGTRSGKFNVERICEALEEFKVTNITMIPTAYRELIAFKDLGKYDIRIERMTYTGEHMDLETFHQVKKKLGKDPCSLYGSTEVGVIIANFAGFKDWKVKPGSLGKPMLGLEVAIIDENNKPLPPNTIGDIAVKLGDKWVRVGDSGLMDYEGYFWYKGRSDDVIKSSGYRIGPEEVESILNIHEAVLESAVIGVPDKVRGQIVKAFIKLKPGYEPNEKLKEKIQLFAREKLSKYAYPRDIEFIDEIPKTADGKIKRKELRMKELKKLEKEC
jgi:acetyl-CoA synthetase